MSSLIELATEFLDRMGNPAYGSQVNEDYATRLTRISDEDFQHSLSAELGRLKDPSALTPYGWICVLHWSRETGARLNDDLLIQLCEKWESAAFKAQVIDVAVPEDNSIPEPPDGGVEQFPQPWLRELLVRAVQEVRRPGREPFAEESFPAQHSGHVESLLMALISVERPVTIAAASALLREYWDGQGTLLNFFWGRVDDLDEETAALWQDTMSPPRRRTEEP
jgi:hypothetical protein